MENKNIIITGIQAWDIEIGSNCKNIALELSKKKQFYTSTNYNDNGSKKHQLIHCNVTINP